MRQSLYYRSIATLARESPLGVAAFLRGIGTLFGAAIKSMDFEFFVQSFLIAWVLVAWLGYANSVALQLFAAKWNWMVRGILLAIAFSPAIVLAAYEIYWMLLASAVASIALLGILQRSGIGKSTQSRNAPPVSRFSIRSGLFLIAVCAAGLALARVTPLLNGKAWLSLVLIAVVTSLILGLAYYAIHARMSVLARSLMILGVLVVALPLAAFDWLLVSFSGFVGWAPEENLFTGGTWKPIHAGWPWIPMCVVLFCFSAARIAASSWPWTPARWSLEAILAAVLIPPMLVTSQLYFVPEFPPPANTENAYPRLVALSAEIENSEFEQDYRKYGDWQLVPPALARKRLAEIEPTLTEIEHLLSLPALAPIDFLWQDMPIEQITGFRSASRAFVAFGRSRLDHGDLQAACNDFVSAMRLGVKAGDGGLIIHQLVGDVCVSHGLAELTRQRSKLNESVRPRLIQQLLEFEKQIESADSVYHRERIWMMRQGWHNHLCVRIADWSGDRASVASIETLEDVIARRRVLLTLLMTELAIHEYWDDFQSLPASLSELVPTYLPSLPRDSCSPAGDILKYELESGSYRLYSVGENGIDDGGTATTSGPLAEDLLLDAMFL